jgi:hypothetical protein
MGLVVYRVLATKIPHATNREESRRTPFRRNENIASRQKWRRLIGKMKIGLKPQSVVAYSHLPFLLGRG